MLVISPILRVCVYIIGTILSILCGFFVLYYLLFDRTLRHSLHNHVTIILLCNSLIALVTRIPWYTHYNLKGGVWERSLLFCEILAYFEWTAYIIQGILFAWANLERHILIFHDSWVSTYEKRCFVHYLPLIFLLSYCLIFYFIVVFFPPCNNLLIQSSAYCIYTCMQDNHIYLVWETIVHLALPPLIIILSSITLFLRILRQKYRIHRHLQWRKHQKMAFQVLAISLLYLVFAFPYSITSFLYEIGIWNSTIYTVSIITSFLTYFTYFLFPFICALSLPDVKNKIKNIFCIPGPQTAIHPTSRAMRTINN